MARSTSSALVTSATSGTTRRPVAFPISAASPSTYRDVRALMMTSAPASARTWAIPFPIPPARASHEDHLPGQIVFRDVHVLHRGADVAGDGLVDLDHVVQVALAGFEEEGRHAEGLVAADVRDDLLRRPGRGPPVGGFFLPDRDADPESDRHILEAAAG